MKVYATEQEQLEALKAWWKRNGKLVISTILIAIVISFGWRYWQENHVRKITEASVLYESMLISLANKDENSFNKVVNELEKKYAHTIYASLAELFSAKKAADEGKLETAQRELEHLIKKGHTRSIRQLAKIRLARIFVAQKQPQKALEMLENMEDAAYLAATHLVKGDAYLALNKPDQARQFYQLALSEVAQTEPMRDVIQMKLENIKE